MNLILVGILNCTPDSFSDGDPNASFNSLYARACRCIDEGATVLDIGGDSTRPGSVCVSDEEEWRRIKPLLSALAHKITISVDTHKASIASRAIEYGAKIINDVGGARNSELVEAVAQSGVHYVYMYSRSGAPHDFLASEAPHQYEAKIHSNALDSGSKPLAGDSSLGMPHALMNTLSSWEAHTSSNLRLAGVPAQRQIFDTGLGAFVSSDPEVSLAIIERYWEIAPSAQTRMFGCSRKGFLKRPGERTPADRDSVSASYGVAIAAGAPAESTVYLRVHNVEAHYQALDAAGLRVNVRNTKL